MWFLFLQRIVLLEKRLAVIDPSGTSPVHGNEVKTLIERFDRFEATVSLKMNVMENKYKKKLGEIRLQYLFNKPFRNKIATKKPRVNTRLFVSA